MKDLCEFMDEDDFNPELQLIADTCGRETALQLAEEFGGRRSVKSDVKVVFTILERRS